MFERQRGTTTNKRSEVVMQGHTWETEVEIMKKEQCNGPGVQTSIPDNYCRMEKCPNDGELDLLPIN